MDSKYLNKKKNEDYKKFLNVTNRKPAIFRDIIIESEYDPLEPNRHCVKAKTGKLADPVKISERKAVAESGMLGSASAKNRPPRGKDKLAVELWASGQIEATPYGTFAKMMDSKGDSPGNEARSATMKSHITFDHFSYPKGNAVVQEEMPRGKRVFPTTTYADPSRVFGHLPPNVEKEIAQIAPPENRRPY